MFFFFFFIKSEHILQFALLFEIVTCVLKASQRPEGPKGANTLLYQALQGKAHKQELDLGTFMLYIKTNLETYSLN